MPTVRLPDDNTSFSNYSATVSIKGIALRPQNVKDLVIRESWSSFNLIPTLEMTILDNGILSEQYPLEDEDEIIISISRSKSQTPVILMKFNLHDYTLKNESGDAMNLTSISLTAFLKNKNMLFPIQTRVHRSKNSMELFSELASENNYSVDIRTKTNDQMNWIQSNQSNYSMMIETLKRAYKEDDAIIAAITRDSKLICSSLKTEQKNKVIKEAIYNPALTTSENIDDSDPTIYFSTFDVINLMGTNNKEISYGIQWGQYNFRKIEKFKIFSNSLLLSNYGFKNKKNSGKISDSYQPQPLNTKNVHANYFKAMAQNKYYIEDFFKEGIVLNIAPNRTLNLFDKVNLNLPSYTGKGINPSQSGEYLVAAINYQMSQDGLFRCVPILFRNGFNQSSFMPSEDYSSIKK